jgi:hypothetical protein
MPPALPQPRSWLRQIRAGEMLLGNSDRANSTGQIHRLIAVLRAHNAHLIP